MEGDALIRLSADMELQRQSICQMKKKNETISNVVEQGVTAQKVNLIGINMTF